MDKTVSVFDLDYFLVNAKTGETFSRAQVLIEGLYDQGQSGAKDAKADFLLAQDCLLNPFDEDQHRALSELALSCIALGISLAVASPSYATEFSRERATRAANQRHANDPKQADKALVRECWDDWQKQPDRYNGKASFARDMRDKFPDLKNQIVIERWCRAWEREA